MPYDASYTRQRLVDLLKCDLTLAEIADAAGWPVEQVAAALYQPTVHWRLHQAICHADRELMGPTPGWDDVDEVVVYRLVNRHPLATPPRKAERREAVRQLRLNHGMTWPQIAEHLGILQRTVHRDMVALGLIGFKPGVAA